MGITYGDHLIDSGYYDITPEQEREIDLVNQLVAAGYLREDAEDIVKEQSNEAVASALSHKRAMVGGV